MTDEPVISLPLGWTRDKQTVWAEIGFNRPITPEMLRRTARILDFLADDWGELDMEIEKPELPTEEPTPNDP